MPEPLVLIRVIICMYFIICEKSFCSVLSTLSQTSHPDEDGVIISLTP